jgi:hypothetical protein
VPGTSQAEITGLLLAWRGGNDGAFERLTPLVYQELRRLARGHMRAERPGHLLQTTALVNEAYRATRDLAQALPRARSESEGLARRGKHSCVEPERQGVVLHCSKPRGRGSRPGHDDGQRGGPASPGATRAAFRVRLCVTSTELRPGQLFCCRTQRTAVLWDATGSQARASGDAYQPDLQSVRGSEAEGAGGPLMRLEEPS